jgi:phage tail-like protein
MSARDANNATWYILRYATDFTPRVASAADPAPPQFVPPDAPALRYDESRNVLELAPVAPSLEVQPPHGFVVGLNGEVYRVEPASRRLETLHCDGTRAPLPCGVAAAAGLALDRRGFLYVTDPTAGRVVVLRPEDRSNVVILRDELTEPVDVAVAPNGQVFVADRAAGRIERYGAGFRHLGGFVPRGKDGLPAKPRPIAVMVDSDASLLVADGNYPWLLRFSASGEPLGDVSLAALAGALMAQGVSLDDPATLLGGWEGPAIVGFREPCFLADDAGVVLARMHRAVRLLSLRLSHSFATKGVVLTAALDGGMPGTIWHKLLVDAVLPEGGWMTVETATADSAAALAGADLAWQSAMKDGQPIPFTSDIPDQLVQSPPGRYLRARITLGSDGRETPSLVALQVIYPRNSYLAYLPRIYQRDPISALFLQRYLALFERVLTGIEASYEDFYSQLDPDAAPEGVLDWMAQLLDLSFDPSWSLAQRRTLIKEATALHASSGSAASLARQIEIYTGSAPLIIEGFHCRPAQPPLLGVGRGFLGCGIQLMAPSPHQSPARALATAYAHRFTVLVYLCQRCDAVTVLPVVEQIIAMSKPAHTAHTLVAIYPDARVGIQSTIGIDYIVGGSTSPYTQLDARTPDRQAGALGIGTVLTDTPPQYTRPVTQVL